MNEVSKFLTKQMQNSGPLEVEIKGVEILTLKGEKGEKGEDGYTPVKGVDYFDGQDGLNGIDGKDADEEKIIKAVISKIPKPKNGRDGKDADPLKPETVVKETIKHLTSLKGDERLSLRMFKESDDLLGKVQLHSNMMSKMPKSLVDGDQRWGGGGITSSTFLANQVLTGSGTSWQLPSKAAAVIAITGQGQWLSPNSRGTPPTPDYVLGADLQTITTTNPWNTGDLEATYIAYGN